MEDECEADEICRIAEVPKCDDEENEEEHHDDR